jgi:serine/threonine protein kinase
VSPVTPLETGQLIDKRYRLRREIARGGMGTIHAAEHIHTGRRVAIKFLASDLAEVPSLERRLLQESRILELCRGPNVVEAIDAGIDGTRPYLVLEMLEGKSLDTLIATRRKLDFRASVVAFLQLCDALETVHRAGIIHRDVKPSNLFVHKEADGTERLKLLDFGVAKLPAEADAPKLTQAGERLGTYEYMAPEQLLAEPLTHRVDLFAAGITFFECVAGDVPFQGGPREILEAVLHGRRAPALAGIVPEAPVALDSVLARVLAHNPGHRPASARELGDLVRAATGLTAGAGTPALSILEPPKVAVVPRARTFARAPYVTPVRVLSDGGSFDGHAADISEGGLLVMVPRDAKSPERVKLRFCLPISGRVVTLEGVKRWTKEARYQLALGFEFESIPEEARSEIHRFTTLTGS